MTGRGPVTPLTVILALAAGCGEDDDSRPRPTPSATPSDTPIDETSLARFAARGPYPVGVTTLNIGDVLAHSESSFAKSHQVTTLPLMIAGRAGGRLRAGVHVPGNGEPVSRIGLTVQQVMGLPVGAWGTRSMEVSQPVGAILA